MPNKHKNPMLGWHPPAELSAWVRAEAERRDVPYGEILTEALSEYRTKHDHYGGNTMKTRLTITAAAASLALLTTLGLSTSAGAAVTPVMNAHDTGWTHMVRTPAGIEIGQGGAPGAVHLKWSHWGNYAKATGKLIIMHNPKCMPTYLCRYDTYNVRVWMHRVITHHGSEVFSRMRWTYGRAGHVLRLRVGRGGDWDYTP